MNAVLDRSATLDDLLIRWHQWRQGYKPARGFNKRALVVGEYVTSRQYDDTNGALDDALESRIMRQLDFEICELPAMFYAAICVQARALTIGCAVYSSPRLPENQEDRASIISDARAMLLKRVAAAGMM